MQRKRYLWDRTTGTVYENIDRKTAWPTVVGAYDPDRKLLTPKQAANNAGVLGGGGEGEG